MYENPQVSSGLSFLHRESAHENNSSQIPGVNGKMTQVLLFSATFPDEVIPFAKRFCPNPVELRLQKNQQNVKGISQMYIDCPEGEGKYEILIKLYGLMNIGSSIIFVKVTNIHTTRAPVYN